MEESEVKKENEYGDGEALFNHKEYNIINEKNKYILRVEIYEKNIFFIISLNDNNEYNYKAKMSLSKIIDKFELNYHKYFNFDLILNLLDEIYENKKFFIKETNEEYCTLIIKFINVLKESTYEIKLYKNYMKINNKFNNANFENNKIFEMNNKINELNNEIKRKDKDYKDSLDKINIIIDKMNQKILNQEERIKELENKNKDLTNKKENNYEELYNKVENEINEVNQNIKNLENVINNKLGKDIETIKNEINKLNNKISNHESKINAKNKIHQKVEEKENTIDKEKNNVNELELNKKINYEFINDPKKLKFKESITNTNSTSGWNDIFEIFTSYKNNKEYLISPNSMTYDLDILNLMDNEKIESIPGHKNNITTIRYFINDKNKNEYLISADTSGIVIIWDINNNYNIKTIIDTNCKKNIFSCLLIFPENLTDGYIITSTYNDTGKDEDSATKLYSFNDAQIIKYIKNTSNIIIYYLLSWYNKKNNKYYIIQFSSKKIIINNLLEDELYLELNHEPENNNHNGFIYIKDNNDYLCSSAGNGYINIWDLHNKKIFKIINTNGSKLINIIEWNKKYIIIADFTKSFKIIDIEDSAIYKVNPVHKEQVFYIKKLNHPKYGESLLSLDVFGSMKLWTIE